MSGNRGFGVGSNGPLGPTGVTDDFSALSGAAAPTALLSTDGRPPGARAPPRPQPPGLWVSGLWRGRAQEKPPGALTPRIFSSFPGGASTLPLQLRTARPVCSFKLWLKTRKKERKKEGNEKKRVLQLPSEGGGSREPAGIPPHL